MKADVNSKYTLGNLLAYLHWYHWAVVALSLVLTLSAWYVTSQQIEQRTTTQFEFQAEQILDLVQERMAKYEEALWAGVAALHMFRQGPASRQDWLTFSNTLKVESRFPGINGIGVIHHVPPEKLSKYLEWQKQSMPDYSIHPSHSEGEFWPITYIEPQSSNIKAIGLDMAHETNRFTAAKKARDTGTSQITGPITLVQDAKKTPGFLFFAPWYSNKGESAYYGDSESEFLGLVYAPFIMYKLMDGTLANANRQVNFSIHDGDVQLYNELTPDSEDYDPDPMFTQDVTLELYGRPWHFTVQSSKIFRKQHTQNQPLLILIGGILIDILLLVLFVVLSKANKSAVEYADKVTADLQLRQQELERTGRHLKQRNYELEEANKELDQFAFIASHDLKAPLRGITQLAQWIEQDLHDKLTPEISEYISLMKNRITRLEKLLDDLLSYSRVGRQESSYETLCIGQRVEDLFSLLSPPEGFKLECDDQVGEITTLSAPFDQIMRNLLGNAIKHHDRATGLIKVTATVNDGHYQIRVEDDGPGIPPEHLNRVFDLFHTLKPRDEVEGSGLGLSIIKKILDRYECQYTLESNGKKGSCFCFSWPTENRLRAFNAGRDGS